LLVTLATYSFVACSDQGPKGEKPTHPAGIIVSNRTVGFRPYAAAVTPAGRMLVAQLDNGMMVTEVLPDTTFDESMAVGAVPTDIGLNAAGNLGFVANQYDDEIQVFNPNIGQTVGYVQVSGDPFTVVSDASGSTIFVTTNRDSLYKITVSNSFVQARLSTDLNTAQSLAFSPVSGLLYVSTRDGGTVLEVNPATLAFVRRFSPGARTQEVAVTKDGRELWIANEGGFVTVVTLATGASLDLPIGGQLWGLAISPDQARVWVGSLDEGVVKVIDRATKAAGAPIAVGGRPRRIRFSRLGEYAVVANEYGYISVIK
jgi:YVTN family beta-propeller protein